MFIFKFAVIFKVTNSLQTMYDFLVKLCASVLPFASYNLFVESRRF